MDEARTLIDDARKALQRLKEAHPVSQDEQEVSPGLRVGIKNFLQNFRSALDHTANEIADCCGDVWKARRGTLNALSNRTRK